MKLPSTTASSGEPPVPAEVVPHYPAEASAEALQQRLDRIADHLIRATLGLERLGAALGFNPQPPEQKMTKQNNEQVPA